MRRSQLSLAYIEVALEPDLGAKCQQKHALELQPLREHGGQKSTGNRRLFQLRSLANEQCQPRLVARSQRLNEQGGRRSSGRRKRPEVDEGRSFSEQANPAAQRHLRYCSGEILRAVTIRSNELGEKTIGPIAPGFVKLRFTGRRIMHLSISNLKYIPLLGRVCRRGLRKPVQIAVPSVYKLARPGRYDREVFLVLKESLITTNI
jgi:hypothetical protein